MSAAQKKQPCSSLFLNIRLDFLSEQASASNASSQASTAVIGHHSPSPVQQQTPLTSTSDLAKSPAPSPTVNLNFIGNGRPPGSFALPGIHSVAAAARSKAAGNSESSNNHQSVEASSSTVHSSKISEMNPIGATTSTRNIYSPAELIQSPLNGGVIGMSGFPAPGSSSQQQGSNMSPPPALLKNERPSNLGSVIGVNPTINNNNNPKAAGKKTRWLLCYPSGGAASSESPSPPNEEAPVGSNASTPSPTDGGFKIPNSQSNERPTSLPVALLNSSQRNGSKYNVNPLSIDPNERVTPSHPAMAIHDHVNGLMDGGATVMDDIPDLSIAVTEIGVIPPPPMFSSPSPPPPPPPPTLTSNQVANGHVIVNHQVFHTNITVDGHDLSQHQQDSPPTRYIMTSNDDDDENDHNGHHHGHQDEEELEDEDELEDEFEEYPYNQPGVNTRVITTVPAKEPVYNAVPLKSALKKPKAGPGGANGMSIMQKVEHSSSSR